MTVLTRRHRGSVRRVAPKPHVPPAQPHTLKFPAPPPPPRPRDSSTRKGKVLKFYFQKSVHGRQRASGRPRTVPSAPGIGVRQIGFRLGAASAARYETLRRAT